jgi:uncharacterized protein (DUF2141 family)
MSTDFPPSTVEKVFTMKWKILLGMPKEPVGLSNYTSVGVSNPPTFRKALFELNESGSLKVKLNPF